MFKMLKKVALASALVAWAAPSIASEPLKIDVFNPGTKSLFPVTSTLVSGKTEAILVDAQFQKNDALSVVDMIKKSGKNLKAVYISHKDPDFYFGLDEVLKAFPSAKVYASPKTLEGIKASAEGKMNYWGPILKENAPTKLIYPEVLKGDTLKVDGEELKVVGLNGHDPKHTFVWVPSIQTAIGGILVDDNQHVWIADTQTKESRAKWYKSLDVIKALNPKTVVPGHFVGASNFAPDTIEFTRIYIQRFEAEAEASANSKELVAKMMKAYPTFKEISSLELSAKVIKGEMQWPVLPKDK